MAMETERTLQKGTIAQVVASLFLLLLGFSVVAWSDASVSSTHLLLVVTILLYALADFSSLAVFGEHGVSVVKAAPTIALHWAAVFVAVYLMYYFVAAGRIANADTGLAFGVILALGLFTAGTRGDWRMLVLGAALAAATAGVATFERYVWLLVVLGALAAIPLVVGARWTARNRAAKDMDNP